MTNTQTPISPPSESSSERSSLSGIAWVVVGIVVVVGSLWLLLALALSTTSVKAEDPDDPDKIRVFGDYVPQSGQQEWPEFSHLFRPAAKSLQATIQQQAQQIEQADDQISIGISVRAITDGEHIAYQENRPFVAASTSKLITAAAVLSMVDAQRLNLQQIVQEQTIEQHLQRMINQSDNQSWEALNQRIGYPELQKYAKQIGLHSFQAYGNTISPHDLAVFLQLLYRYELLSDSSTEQLLSWMQGTNQETLLPAAFAQADRVYHKYGWLGANLHDAGIIVYRGQPFVVVIMTEGGQNLNQSRQMLLQLAQPIQSALK